MSIHVVTSTPVASTSPDHLIPNGTAHDNFTSIEMIRELAAIFPNLRLLDIGCSSGQFVSDCLAENYLAVGLEGSDYSLIRKRPQWDRLAGINLFTCDVSQPFSIEQNTTQIVFNVVTTWDVLEHIPLKDLPQVMSNIHKHLEPNGIFIGTVSVAADPPWHQTVMAREKWITDIFSPLFTISPYPFTHTVRPSATVADSFHFMATPI